MGSIEELLAEARRRDIRLSVEGDKLRCNAPKGALTPELRAALSAHKEALKAHLAVRAGAESDGRSRPVRIARGPEIVLADAQQRLWFFKQMDPSSAAYNVFGVLRIRGALHTVALENSLIAIIDRHESLRTRFAAVDGTPRAIIERNPRWQMVHVDLSEFAPGQQESEAMRRVTEACSEPFDYARCPLFRAVLVRLSDDEHVLALVLDHIIADGWSTAVLIRELIELYTADVLGRAPELPVLELQFADYAEWQRARLKNGLLEAQLPYWLEQLGGALPVLQLPTDRPRPPVQTYRGARCIATFPRVLAESLRAAARREGVTLFMLLLGAFKALLARYTGMEDIIVGSATAGRSHPDAAKLIGFFVNNIVLRTDLGGDPTVRELLARVKDVALNAYAHQDVPFDVLVERLRPRRELDRAPLFQAMFVLQNLPYPTFTLPGLEVTVLEGIEIGTSRLDVSMDVFDRPEGLKVILEYNTDIFESAAMERMLEHYRMLLEGFTSSPDARIGELPILSTEERDRILRQWNPQATDYHRDACIHELFEAQAGRSPQREAVCFEGRSLTYGMLDERANRLANYLRGLGVGPDRLVGVWLERSEEMVVALLAVLKAGGAYVPLDPAFPRERIDYMVRDSGLRILVTQRDLAATLYGSEGIRVVELDTHSAEIVEESSAPPAPVAKARDLAYVIYTSGSTGKPKGVQLEHRSVVNFLESMHREPGLNAQDRFVSVTTLSFDIAALEIFGPLTIGGAVIIADRATALDGERLAALLESSRATVLQGTPATWRLLLESGWHRAHGLKLLSGGEPLPRDLADRLLATGGELWNLYGPTETTVWSTVAQVLPGDEHPGIGRPIANTKVYILDAGRHPVPVGVPGELYIGGDGLARGYLGRPELTAERFVPDPFVGEAGARMYRTGDLARWRVDGTIHCLGRTDNQVKIRGYRIEPGEIEAALMRHPGVAQTVVVARKDGSGEHRLVAYLTPAGEARLEPEVLRRFLAEGLPDYMIPSVFVPLDAFPLTPNGKVDRNALPEPDVQNLVTGSTYAPPEQGIEAAVAAIWQDVLRLERVGRNDNFFDLGGHSLLIVQVQSRIQTLLGKKVTLVDLFQHTTVAALAAFLENGPAGADNLARVRERAARQREARRRAELTTGTTN